jgi:CheY-like chemotaxis protein
MDHYQTLGIAKNATPDDIKKSYRKFTPNAAATNDDFGMMKEVLRRRFSKLVKDEEAGEDSPRPDLVLMDCGMPVMDGFESTRRIRAWEQTQPGRVRVPIVALTASALAGDREACLSAGMDDYLVKPVSSSRLSETLARHLSGPARRVPTPTPAPLPVMDAPAAAAAPPLVYDAAVLASLPMVADGSHPGFVHKMQRMFADSNARMLADIDSALAAGDTQSMMRLLHSMKSASAQVGAMELSALARTFETQLRTGGAPAARWPVQLRQAFERLLTAWPELQQPAEPLR